MSENKNKVVLDPDSQAILDELEKATKDLLIASHTSSGDNYHTHMLKYEKAFKEAKEKLVDHIVEMAAP